MKKERMASRSCCSSFKMIFSVLEGLPEVVVVVVVVVGIVMVVD